MPVPARVPSNSTPYDDVLRIVTPYDGTGRSRVTPGPVHR